jgi:prevent-host-death family protein
MTNVGIHQAKTHLSELLRRVATGEEIVIMRGQEPVARLVPVRPLADRRQLGTDEGLYEVPDDFDAPLPDDILATFQR